MLLGEAGETGEGLKNVAWRGRAEVGTRSDVYIEPDKLSQGRGHTGRYVKQDVLQHGPDNLVKWVRRCSSMG
jgi:hypothetical protein